MLRLTVAVSVWLTMSATLAFAQDAPSPADLLSEHSCTGCHTTDGTDGPGPTLAGLFERETTVMTGGRMHTLTIDDAYVVRSMSAPADDVVEGYTAMPDLRLSDEEIASVITALHSLRPEEAPFETIWLLAFGTLGFLLTHLTLSFHPIRRRLIGRLGAKGFERLYSVAVLIPFACIFAGWHYRPYVELWELGPWARWVPNVVMPIAFYFMIAGYTTKNPTNPATAPKPGTSPAPRGVTTITRHPALWGFGLWGLAHLLPNGDLASLLLFGSIAALAGIGMLHSDRRRARSLGKPWAEFVNQTSVLPFVAVLTGRTKLDVSGMWWRLLVAAAAHGFMLAIHEWEFSVSPFPYL